MVSDSSASPVLLAGYRSPRSRVRLLLDGGDRANAHGEADTLAQIARELIADVPRPLQYELVAVAELARLNFDVAQRRWVEISDRIRARSGVGDS